MTEQRKHPGGRPREVDSRIVVGLPADLLADLDAEAATRGMPRSKVIRERLARRKRRA